MDKVSNAMHITADISQNKKGDAAIRGIALGLGQAAGAVVDSQISNVALKTVVNTSVDQAIDSVKEKSLNED